MSVHKSHHIPDVYGQPPAVVHQLAALKSNIYFPMKTRQNPQLCQVEENFVLGLKLICFAADLLRCLESNLPENKSVPETDAVILDGTAVVQMLKPNTSRTFQEYGETVFVLSST